MEQPVVEKLAEVKRSLNLTEIGVIVSLLGTLVTGVFSMGVLYGQVQSNSKKIERLEPKVEAIMIRMERIDANVEFLVERQRESN